MDTETNRRQNYKSNVEGKDRWIDKGMQRNIERHLGRSRDKMARR